MPRLPRLPRVIVSRPCSGRPSGIFHHCHYQWDCLHRLSQAWHCIITISHTHTHTHTICMQQRGNIRTHHLTHLHCTLYRTEMPRPIIPCPWPSGELRVKPAAMQSTRVSDCQLHIFLTQSLAFLKFGNELFLTAYSIAALEHP